MALSQKSQKSQAALPTTRLGLRNHLGLALAAVLAVGDIAGPFSLDGAFDPSQPGPPMDVLWFCFATGVVTVVGVGLAWAGVWRRPAIRLAALARVLSAITSLPAFFVQGVPAGLVALAGGGVVLTLLTVWLMLVRPRPARAAAPVTV